MVQAKAKAEAEVTQEAPAKKKFTGFHRLLNSEIVLGAKAAWPIMNDIYPAIIVDYEAEGLDDNDRPGSIITLLVARQNLAGESYPRVQRVLSQFVFTRPQNMDDHPLVDGQSMEDALNNAGEQLADFLASRATDTAIAAG